MNRYIKMALFVFIAINLFLSSFFLLKGDVYFNTDIARDFLLLDELEQKKLVLIGPRASGQSGFFHGPLWMYINYPIYLLSKGNPVVQGWFWFILLLLYIVGSYTLWKKKIGSDKSLVFVSLLSLFFTIDIDRGFSNGFYNPFGALFLMPFYLYFFYSYLENNRGKDLFIALLLNGLIIQFQIAFGAPLLILTAVLSILIIVKRKLLSQLFTFFVLLIPASTYIVFDLRHNFSLFKAIFFPPYNPYIEKVPFIPMLMERITMITSNGLHFFREPLQALNSIVAIYFLFAIYFYFKTRTQNQFLRFFLYLYIGYFLLSLVHNGWLIYFYWMQIYPVSFLFFVTSQVVMPKKIFFTVLLGTLFINTLWNISLINKADYFVGKKQNSWKFQSLMIENVFKKTTEKEFGFFIHAPDIYGYSSKYPFTYWQKKYPNIKAVGYEKKQVTYVVIEPAPSSMKWLDSGYYWWLENKLHMATQAAEITYYPNGFRVEKFIVKESDLKKPIEPGVNDWITFR